MTDEREYTIPLRKEFLKAPRYKKTKRAVSAIKLFIKKHMKAEKVKIGKNLNLEVWKHGRKNPPSKIRVHTIKDGDAAKVELIGVPFEKPEKKESKEKTKGDKNKGTKIEESKKVEEKKEQKAKEEKKKEVKTKTEEKPKENKNKE